MSAVDEAHELCRLLDWRMISPQVFIERCAKITLSAIGCSQVGLWLFATSDSGLQLRCLGIYDGESHRMLELGSKLKGADRYYDALAATGYVMADDVLSCESTKGFFGLSLHEQGVLSLMATSFSVNGKLHGAFCCAAVGKYIQWTTTQLVLLKRIGGRASISLANSSLSRELSDALVTGLGNGLLKEKSKLP